MSGAWGKNGLFTWKRAIAGLLALGFGLVLLLTVMAYGFQSRMKEMFRLNRELQAQNYYMVEFEYRLLGISYLLDKGQYGKSFDLFNRYYEQLKSREGLIKLPEFNSPDEELEFYLNLQNAETGAFMDAAYPMCVYHGPTENVLQHIEQLAKRADRPVKLKYPLKYLDQINTPEKLTAFLNDVSTVGFISSKMPQTSFHTARDVFTLARDNTHYDSQDLDILIEKHNLYHFSPEWKKTLLHWFHEAQDPSTGLWGPKSASGKLVKKDLQNTSSILKAFRDKSGNDVHREFPLRYTDQLVSSALEILAESPPKDDDLAWLHEWNLKTIKGLHMMTRYLWKDMSPTTKDMVADLFKDYIRILCEKYYIPEEGGFSYYPNSKHASLDGAGSFLIFKDIGALSTKKQQQIWGSFDETVIKNYVLSASRITKTQLQSIARRHEINSFRSYEDTPDPDCLFSGVRAVVYPNSTPVPDIMELTQGMKRFLTTTDLGMGNWVSREAVSEALESIVIPDAVVWSDTIPEAELEDMLSRNKEVAVIGFDLLQIPRCRIAIR